MAIATQHLDRHGLTFLRSELSRYGGLRRQLLGLDLAAGSVFAFWPHGIRIEAPSDFQRMLYDPREEMMTPQEAAHDRHAVSFIRRYLNNRPGRYLLVQDYHSYATRRDDAGQLRVAIGERAFLYRRADDSPPREHPDELWLFLTGPRASNKDVELTLSRGMLYPPALGIVTQMPLGNGPEHGHYVDDVFVRDVVLGIHAIVIVAFDRQMLLFWGRGQRQPAIS